MVVNIDDESFSVYVKSTHSGYEVLHDRSQMVIKSAWILGNRLFHGEVDGIPVNVQIEYFAGGFYLTHAGEKVKISVRTPRVAELDRYMPEPKSGVDSSKVEAPISGVIVDIKVKDGDKVKQGQELFILEAMKMENIICAEKDAKIKKVYLNANDNTTYGQVVIEYENA